MLRLLFLLFEWAVKLTVLFAVLVLQLVAATYRATERAIHNHRSASDPHADRSISQAMAAGVVAVGIGVIVLVGSVFGGGGSPAASSPARAASAGSMATLASVTESASPAPNDSAAQRRAARRRAALRKQAQKRVEARRRAAIARRRAVLAKRRAAARRRAEARRALLAAQTPTPTPTPTMNCDPSYAGACLDPNAYDYDCAGGSGDGPKYTGEVRVVGSDHFGLDRDGDGIACES